MYRRPLDVVPWVAEALFRFPQPLCLCFSLDVVHCRVFRFRRLSFCSVSDRPQSLFRSFFTSNIIVSLLCPMVFMLSFKSSNVFDCFKVCFC